MDAWKLTEFSSVAKLIPRCHGSKLFPEYHSFSAPIKMAICDSWEGKCHDMSMPYTQLLRESLRDHFSISRFIQRTTLWHHSFAITETWFLHEELVLLGSCKTWAVLGALGNLPPQASSGEAICCVLVLRTFCFSFLVAWLWDVTLWITYHLGQPFGSLPKQERGSGKMTGAQSQLFQELAIILRL